MPSISQRSLIFPCYNTALPSFMTFSMLLCYGISFLLLSSSPSFSICMSILISDVLLLFQSLSFALFDFLNWLIASLSLPLFLPLLNSLLIYPSRTSTIYISCSIFLHLLLYLTFPLPIAVFLLLFLHIYLSLTFTAFDAISQYAFLTLYGTMPLLPPFVFSSQSAFIACSLSLSHYLPY